MVQRGFLNILSFIYFYIFFKLTNKVYLINLKLNLSCADFFLNTYTSDSEKKSKKHNSCKFSISNCTLTNMNKICIHVCFALIKVNVKLPSEYKNR